ncbi:methyltransferase family protein [Thermodesulfobacteriota bacterium]
MNLRHHHDRDDLVGEYAAGDAGQIILAVLFAVIWITDTFFLRYTIFLNNYVPLSVRIVIGTIILIMSGYLAKTGLSVVFGEEGEEPGVIRKSVFGIVRHPIYLSEILLYLGLFMLSISLASAVVLVIAIVFLHYISRYEEGLLLDRFGEEYEQYMREVPMWIPRPWKG